MSLFTHNFLYYFLNNTSQNIGFLSVLFFILAWRELNLLESCVAILIIMCTIGDAIAAYAGFYYDYNMEVYNIAVFFETLIVFYIYYNLFSGLKLQRFIVILSYIFILFYLADCTFIQGWKNFNSYSLISAMVVVAILSYLYLKHVVENINHSPWQDFFFWFSVANMVQYAGSIPVLSMYLWYSDIDSDAAQTLYDDVNTILYCSWYLIIIIGFLWTHKQPKLTSS